MIPKNKLNTIYIISKGRPRCLTGEVLKKMNYSGEWFIVCGNNDETIPEYQKIWGKKRIIVFDWLSEAKESDLLDNFGIENMSSGAVPVRNAVRKISAERGELRHWQLDDDYYSFKHITKDFKRNYVIRNGKFFENELYRIASFAHKAKLSNTGFCLGMESFPSDANKFGSRVFNAHNLPSTEDLFTTWRGRMNDDLINAIEVYHKGRKEMSFKFISLILKPTQSEAGGNSDIYKDWGTIRKTAYAVMIEPNAVKLVIKFGRYHHLVNWRKLTPKTIREEYARS